DLDDAHAARAVHAEARVVAVVRHLDAVLDGGFEDALAFVDRQAASIYRERDRIHISGIIHRERRASGGRYGAPGATMSTVKSSASLTSPACASTSLSTARPMSSGPRCSTRATTACSPASSKARPAPSSASVMPSLYITSDCPASTTARCAS